MQTETLKRALDAVRDNIATLDTQIDHWMVERERRRRQERVFLQGIVDNEESGRKAAEAAGMSEPTFRRTLRRR